MAIAKTISTDTGKPETAVPVTDGCVLPGAAIQGELTGFPLSIPKTESTEPWAARHNAEIWGAGHWRSDAAGFYE